MKRSVKQWYGGLLALALLAGLAMPAHAQTATGLGCKVSQGQVNAGETFELVIEISQVSGLYAFQFELAYPREQVALQDSIPGQSGTNFSLGNFLKPDFVAQNAVDEKTGKGTLAVTQVNPSQPVDGSGVLARVQVKALKAGAVSFQFNNISLVDGNMAMIPFNLSGCQVEVLGSGQPTRAATSAPVATSMPTAALATLNPSAVSVSATEAPVEAVESTPAAENTPAVEETVVEAVQPTSAGQAQAALADDPIVPTATGEMKVMLPAAMSAGEADEVDEAGSSGAGFLAQVGIGLGIVIAAAAALLGGLWLRSRRRA